MAEYITKKEATEILERSMSCLDNYIASGKISKVPDPKDRRKKLLLASEVYRVKEEITAPKSLTPELLESVELEVFRLDLLDVIALYNVPVSTLSFYEEEIQAIASLSVEERKEAFNELVHKIVTPYMR